MGGALPSTGEESWGPDGTGTVIVDITPSYRKLIGNSSPGGYKARVRLIQVDDFPLLEAEEHGRAVGADDLLLAGLLQ